MKGRWQRFSHRRFEKIWNGKALLAAAKAERAQKQEERAPLIASKLAARELRLRTEAAAKAAEVREARRVQERKDSAAGRTPLREKLAAMTEFMTVTDPLDPGQSVAMKLPNGGEFAMGLVAPTSFRGFELVRTSRAGDRAKGLAVSHYQVIPPLPSDLSPKAMSPKEMMAWADKARSVAKPALQMMLLHPNGRDTVLLKVQPDSGLIRDIVPLTIQPESKAGSQPTSSTPPIATRDLVTWAKTALGSAYVLIGRENDILPNNPNGEKHRFDFSRAKDRTKTVANLAEVYRCNMGLYQQTPEEAAVLSYPAHDPSTDKRLLVKA